VIGTESPLPHQGGWEGGTHGHEAGLSPQKPIEKRVERARGNSGTVGEGAVPGGGGGGKEGEGGGPGGVEKSLAGGLTNEGEWGSCM